MKNAYLVAVIAGLAAAALQAAMQMPSVAGIVLFSLSSLPLFVTGFAFGPLPAAVAGVVGTLVLIAFANWQAGFVFLAMAAIAPVVLTWLALKHRQSDGAAASEGEVTAAGLQWYPEGRLVLWAAGLAVALMLASFLAGGGDLEALRTATTGVARRIGEVLTNNDPARISEVDTFVKVMVVLVPPATTIIWHLATMICLWLAARIVAASKLGLRPWAPFAALRFPPMSLWALGGAGLLVMASGITGPSGAGGGMSGLAGFAGSLALGAMTSAFMLLGLAVVHGLTTGLAGRSLILASLYLALVLLQGVMLAPLVALAVADMVFDLRRRAAGQGPPAKT